MEEELKTFKKLNVFEKQWEIMSDAKKIELLNEKLRKLTDDFNNLKRFIYSHIKDN